MEKIPNSIITMLLGIGVTLISLWYGKNHGLLPIPATDEAEMVDGLFNTMMTIATGLFILVEGALIIAAIRFRRRPGDDTDGPPIRGNIPLEILWTAIPAVLVMVIAVYSFEVYNAMGGLDPMVVGDHSGHKMARMSGAAIAATLPGENDTEEIKSRAKIAVGLGASPSEVGKPADLVIDVTGLQYAWIFNYPELGISSGELHLPAGRDVQLNIAASDVIHSLWIPEFRLKQDAIPGRDTELRFIPKIPGSYSVVCAELCGSYHGSMRTQAIVHTTEDFDSWVESQKEMANQDALQEALAANPANLSEAEFLTPYTQEMGVTSDTIAQIRDRHHHH